jgi:hypothetical protein
LVLAVFSCHTAGVNKKQRKPTPTPSKYSVVRQLCNLIPEHLVPKLARETKVDEQCRTFSAWSHVVALLFAQLTHAVGLNDVCDALRLYLGPLAAVRGATPPSRNNLSHANKHRDASLAEKLFWGVLHHLKQLHPRFAGSKAGKRLMHRFNRTIHLVDSTTIQLVASCMDWAKHRRRKAAAKCHLRLDLQSFLPRFAIIDTAKDHDNKRAQEVCAGVRPGEIVIFDKAYVWFTHLLQLTLRQVNWVTRAKDNMDYRVVQRRQYRRKGNILRDDLIELKTPATHQKYPQGLRRVLALVELDGRWQEMAFLTNNLEWSAQTIADLYRCRWQIEVFFKQIKQTLQLADFLGQSANAVKWQVWIALLTYVLLRFLACLHQWEHSFTRLWTLLRAVLWRKLDVSALLDSCGTAQGSFRYLARPEQAYFAHF